MALLNCPNCGYTPSSADLIATAYRSDPAAGAAAEACPRCGSPLPATRRTDLPESPPDPGSQRRHPPVPREAAAPAAPKRRTVTSAWAPFWSVAVGAGIVLMGWAVVAAGRVPLPEYVPPAASPDPDLRLRVTYAVSGTGTDRAIMTMRTDSFATRQVEAELPWETTYSGFGEGDHAYVTARSSQGTGTLRCEIRVDDVALYSGEASGDSICTAAGEIHAMGAQPGPTSVTTTPAIRYTPGTRTAFLDACAATMSSGMCGCLLDYTAAAIPESEFVAPGSSVSSDFMAAGVQACARELSATMVRDDSILLEQAPAPSRVVSAAEMILALDAAAVPILDWVVYTDTTDPDGFLGVEGGYQGKAVFLDERLTRGDGLPPSLDTAVTTFAVGEGGAIEVFDSAPAAVDRSSFLAAGFAVTGEMEYHFVAGPILLRITAALPEAAARDYWAALLEILP